MPGVPSGRGCQQCRKQKKKCDQTKPRCSRCYRLNLDCVGAGHRRFKFIPEYEPQSSKPHQQQSLSSSKQAEVPAHDIVLKNPSNNLTTLLNAFVYAILPSTDLRYNLAWSYGDFLDEIPARLGKNEALDAATMALVEAHSSFCMSSAATVEGIVRYTSALQTLRRCLDDPAKAMASETLCAVNLLQICQFLLGTSEAKQTGHGEGMLHMLLARGSFHRNDNFENMLLASLRGSIIFEALVNPKMKLSSKRWKSLADNPLDGERNEGQLMRSLCLVPYFVDGRATSSMSMEEDDQILTEIKSGYDSLNPILEDLKPRFNAIANRTNQGMHNRAEAYIIRTYGLCLAIAIILNQVISAAIIDNTSLPDEAAAFADDMLTVAMLARNHRPLGSSWAPLCLSIAWTAASDPITKLIIEDALEEHQQHPAYVCATRITIEDLEWTSQRFRLLNPPM